MKSLELCLLSLLQTDKVLTISRTDEGWLITHCDVEVEDGDIYFVPEVLLTSKDSSSEAISSFDVHQSLSTVKGFQA